ncbi:gliding motility lipoprotein GldH [Odoribacter lunatus]|uniref:gliding motility lipoprotein GldH n=1 Tax=Odoribacter lunatus TaxID=2941335 RepID=UPI0020420E65|nr:gliding motility lipoprotein GldH [Odoribacter lunatus]
MKKYILLLISISYFSCQPSYIFEKYNSIPDEEWCIHNIVRFHFSIQDSADYNLYAGIRHTMDYEMGNLWCFIKISDSTHVLVRDTLNIKLAEPDGHWLGSGYTIKTKEEKIKKISSLPQGEYTCEIEQGMRMHCLKGVKDIGLIIKKAEQ